ncbi:MAG: prolipoprotein diacylglyceryl transferase [Lachnospiraceae bacterium]|nr:prolipoprotein diacylglyceryl transferase [Lachnospiraceae bacterium]
MTPDIVFPHLGITISHLSKGITIGDFTIAFYGIIIACGMLFGYLITIWQARRLRQDSDVYIDLAIIGIICAIIGARAYYVIFSWDYYSRNPSQILNIRGGGLAVYGGIIAGVIAAVIFAKIKKLSFWRLMDPIAAGLLIGQVMGRWGNFFNREAFGDYTNNVFAMQIRQIDVNPANITQTIADHITKINNEPYIQVHPTFLYESAWNLCLLIVILFITKYRKFDGELFQIYLLGYGIGRFFIEGLRTDSLLLFGTGIAVSQMLSVLLAVFAFVMIVINFVKYHNGTLKTKS